MNGNGWKQPDSATLVVDWDSDDNLSLVRARVALIRKGCGCKTGCLSGRCKCRKNDSHCGRGCKCQNCHNLPSGSSNTASQPSPLVRQPPNTEIESSDSDDSGDESGDNSCSSSDLEMEVNKLMDDIFGDFGLHEQSEANMNIDF